MSLTKQIEELSLEDATVRAHWVGYMKGVLTYEEMLEHLVIHLAREKQAYFDLKVEAHKVSMSPMMIIPPNPGSAHDERS
jgi:hypothetical protein